MSPARVSVQRDERTIVVENASYRWSYLAISFGLLIVVAYRSLMFHESPWDLLFLVIFAGGLGTAYQAFHHVLTRHWVIVAALTASTAALVAAIFVWLR